MIPLVEFPTIVKHYGPMFKDVFSEEAFVQFERYLSGLIVSENKTVDGMNRLFVEESRNQSSLNRLMTASPFELESLNKARLKVLDNLPGTGLKSRGVLSVDNTLLTHYGHEFEQIAKLYDHVTESYVWAHDLVTLHYSDDETDYPALMQLWKPAELDKIEAGLRTAQVEFKDGKESLKETAPRKWRSYLLRLLQRQQKKHPELGDLYESKLVIAQQLIQHWVTTHPDLNLPISFDSWFTQPAFCRFLDQNLHLAYVGTLTEKDKVNLKTGSETLKTFAERLKQDHLEAKRRDAQPVFRPIHINYKGEQKHYYSYCNTHLIHNFGKQRLVINHDQADLSDNPVFYIGNRLFWHAEGITRVRRHRWPVEVYYEEGKAEGLDQYQLRDFSAIQRHVALVAVAYSLLRAAQHDPVLRDQLQRQLEITLDGNPAAWRRASQAQSLWCLGLTISAGLAQAQSLPSIMAPFIQAICRA
jgi:hypothetical protein